MTDDLELRLRNLPSSAVLRHADESAIGRLEPRSRKSRRGVQILAAAAVALIAVLLANVVVAYFAPRYERAIANSGVGPISQKFLAAVGLNDANVTAVNDSATSSGHTVALAAGYADGLRTVLLLTIDGRGLTGDPKAFGRSPGDYGVDLDRVTLSDQFGRTYGFGMGAMGLNELLYEPLGWPASGVGARLTLHITALWGIWQRPFAQVDGDWTLHATLISSAVHTLPLPAPVNTTEADYRFTGISATDTEMVVHWTVAGPVNDQLAKYRAAPPPANPFSDPLFDQYLRPHVYDEAGTELQFQEFGYTWPKTGPADGGLTVFIKGPGRYRIQIGTVAPAAWVVVP